MKEKIYSVILSKLVKFLENLFKKVLKFYGVQDKMETRTRVIDNLKLIEIESGYTCFYENRGGITENNFVFLLDVDNFSSIKG